jgi:predicted metallo-beta-lactamase superfamily hydrolase
MDIEILGTESLGVRGLSCFIRADNRNILIDPGLAQGFTRYGFHPHPIQAIFGEKIKWDIIRKWIISTDIVITHFHGDHTPLYNANPFQLHLSMLPMPRNDAILWVKSREYLIGVERLREKPVVKLFNRCMRAPCSSEDNIIEVSKPVSHGLSNNTTVLLVKITDGSKTFVHMSDTQLLCREAVEITLSWKPDIVVTDGPPIYRWIRSLPRDEYLKLIKLAENNALGLADNTDLLIIDHHLLRCWEGVKWLQHLKDKTDHIMCAAEYMRKPILLLEAWRPLLYKYFKIDKKWFHKRYNEYVNSTIFKSITKDLVEELKVYTRKHKSFIIPINVIEDILEEIKIKYDFA